MRSLWLISLSLLSVATFSQKIPLIHSGEVVAKGKSLYDSSKFTEAIKEYLKVPERDTNYVYMLTEVALAYIGSEQYDKALSICEQGLAKPSKYTPYFLRYQAIAEDKNGNFNRSVELFETAIKKYRADYSLLYYLGITYYNNKEYEKAAGIFFRVLALNPFHAGSHLNLGRIAIGQGRKVHAMLSLGMYLSVSNTDNARLVLLNNFLDNQVKDEGTIPLFGTNGFEKLDQIIRAKIAMDKNFKSAIPVDAVVVRQFEMFFQQLQNTPEELADPWIKTYLPIYQFIREKDLVEPFIFHVLSSAGNEHVKKWHTRNKKPLAAYFESANTIIKKQREIVSPEVSGFSKPVQAWYDNSNALDALGEYGADEIRKGHWIFYHDNYQLSAEGNYNDKGDKTGIWKYYHDDGTVKSIENYDTGEVTIYFPDGAKREHFYLKKDHIHGEVELYFPCGPLKEKLKYEDGNRQGMGQTYYASGEKAMTYQYTANKADGIFKTLFENGKVSTLANYKDDKLNGVYQSYHRNQKLKSEGQYLNGHMVGSWAHYYSNGRVERKGAYDDEGNAQGEWLYYDAQGILTEKRPFDDADRRQGPNTHYYNNKLHVVYTYKKGVLTGSVFYDTAGKELGKYGSDDGSYATRNYFATGQLQSEGNYKKGKEDGVWKYYNRYGKLISEYHYVDGLLQGQATDYFPSGEKKFLMQYKDNELHGYFQEFYRHGSVKQEGWFQQGNREQQWLIYYPDGTLETDNYYILNALAGKSFNYAFDGKLFSVLTYENNNTIDIKNYDRDGNTKTARRVDNHIVSFENKYQNEKLKSKFEILCGVYTGSVTRWYPDGNIYFSYPMVNGKKVGRYTYKSISGKPLMEGDYLDDQEEGHWKIFYKTGQLSHEGLYFEGSKDSIWNYYYPHGKISSSIPYRKDKVHGEARYYSPEGLPLIDKWYDQGELIAYRTVGATGEMGSWIEFSGTGELIVKNAAVKVVYEETYKNGLRQGSKRLYFDNGKLCEEYTYNRGDLEGPYIRYYPDGRVFEKGVYKKDELEDKREFFRSDGTPLVTEEYHLGTLHGKTIFYIGGKPREYTFWNGIIEK